MNNYDGNEDLYLQTNTPVYLQQNTCNECTASASSCCSRGRAAAAAASSRLDYAIYTAASTSPTAVLNRKHLARVWGQCKVWILLFLFISPAFSKPLRPLGLFLQHNRQPNSRQQQQQDLQYKQEQQQQRQYEQQKENQLQQQKNNQEQQQKYFLQQQKYQQQRTEDHNQQDQEQGSYLLQQQQQPTTSQIENSQQQNKLTSPAYLHLARTSHGSLRNLDIKKKNIYNSPLNRQDFLPKDISNSVNQQQQLLQDKFVVENRIESVYNIPQANNNNNNNRLSLVSTKPRGVSSQSLETENRVSDSEFVSLNTVDTDNHSRKNNKIAIINGDSRTSSSRSVKSINNFNNNNKVVTSLDIESFKVPVSKKISTKVLSEKEESLGLKGKETGSVPAEESLLRKSPTLLPLSHRFSSSIPLTKSTTIVSLPALSVSNSDTAPQTPLITDSPSEEGTLLVSSSISITKTNSGEPVSTVVSRVPRHTVEPTIIEENLYAASGTAGATLVEGSVPVLSGDSMDTTDNVARNGRGGSSDSSSGGSSGSANSRGNTVHWSLPCKIDMASNPLSSPSYLSGNIFTSVNLAYNHAHRFKDLFASQMWDGMDWGNATTMVPDTPFHFLNRLPIQTEEQLKGLKFNDVLLVSYESMQRRAVAIEQVTLDQALYRDLNRTDFLSKFRSFEGEIVDILCELRYAMIQQGVVHPETITAEIMEEKYRDVDSSSGRRMRDTVILREYLNGLDYLYAVFTHFKKDSAT